MANLSDYDLFIVNQGVIQQYPKQRIYAYELAKRFGALSFGGYVAGASGTTSDLACKLLAKYCNSTQDGIIRCDVDYTLKDIRQNRAQVTFFDR